VPHPFHSLIVKRVGYHNPPSLNSYLADLLTRWPFADNYASPAHNQNCGDKKSATGEITMVQTIPPFTAERKLAEDSRGHLEAWCPILFTASS
jgi:hypothetical protein